MLETIIEIAVEYLAYYIFGGRGRKAGDVAEWLTDAVLTWIIRRIRRRLRLP